MLIGRLQFQQWRRYHIVGAVIVMTIFCATANAQDLEPRKYVNFPVDQNFLRVAGGYSWGEVELTPGLPLSDANLTLSGASLAYLRTMDIGGKASAIDMYMGYFCASGTTHGGCGRIR